LEIELTVKSRRDMYASSLSDLSKLRNGQISDLVKNKRNDRYFGHFDDFFPQFPYLSEFFT
jgi:hypothetical protein